MGGPVKAAVKAFHHQMDRGMRTLVVQGDRKKTSLIFFKGFLINAATQSQFVAIYKYGSTLMWRPWGGGGGGGAMANNPCINS